MKGIKGGGVNEAEAEERQRRRAEAEAKLAKIHEGNQKLDTGAGQSAFEQKKNLHEDVKLLLTLTLTLTLIGGRQAAQDGAAVEGGGDRRKEARDLAAAGQRAAPRP